MSDTPETDELARSLLYERLASTETCYYEMRMLARQLERDRDEQCRLLGMSAERECHLRGKIERLEREIEQLKKRLEKAESVKVVRIEFAEENRNKKI